MRAHRVEATDFDQVARLLKGTGPLDWVVSCVGVGYYAPLTADYSPAWKEILRVNVLALANLLTALDRTQPDLAALVVVSSLAAYQPSTTPGNTMYSAAKTAARTLLEQYRSEVRRAGRRLRVCSISPGYVRDTDFGAHYFDYEPNQAVDLYADEPSMRPDDVAGMIEYSLLTPDGVELSE